MRSPVHQQSVDLLSEAIARAEQRNLPENARALTLVGFGGAIERSLAECRAELAALCALDEEQAA